MTYLVSDKMPSEMIYLINNGIFGEIKYPVSQYIQLDKIYNE